jgi:hypothetical protein
MDEEVKLPDPNLKIAVVAVLSQLEAALLAGRLQAEGIRAMVPNGHSAPGPWTALVGSTGFGLAPNLYQKRRRRSSSMNETSRRPAESRRSTWSSEEPHVQRR